MSFKQGMLIKGKYEIARQIGEGGTAVVYLAKNLENDSNVVLKISRTDASVSSLKERFLLEAQSLVKFNNPNIVKVYEYFEYEKSIIIVMEYLDGKTLKEIIQSKKEVQISQIIGIMLQVLNALKDIHREGIVHRDLKPENLMVCVDGTVKLMDFGIVQISMEQNLTRQGFVIGTISYMSPEVISRKKAMPQSEIYSLGVVLYYLLTKSLPFKNGDPSEIARKAMTEKPIMPSRLNPNVDEYLNQIVMKMMEKDYLDRYQSATELIEVFNNYLKLTNSDSKDALRLLKLSDKKKESENPEKKTKNLLAKFFGKKKK